MKKFLACMLITTFIGVAAIGFVHAQQGAKTEGAKPYTPTRLQWLAVKLNAELGRQFSAGGFQMLFVPKEADNTIVILVNYFKDSVRPGQIEAEIKHTKQVISLTAQARKWEKWLKVKQLVKGQ